MLKFFTTLSLLLKRSTLLFWWSNKIIFISVSS